MPGFSLDSILFFSAGAYFGIFKINFAVRAKAWAKVFVPVYLVAVATEFFFRAYPEIDYLHRVNILIGMCAFVGLTAHFIARGQWRPSAFLAGSSFFVYAYHIMPLKLFIKVSFKCLHPHTEPVLIVLYFLCPALTVAVGLGLYWLLRRYVPRFAALITGGR